MDVKDILKNYRKNTMLIKIAESRDGVNDKVKKMIEDKKVIDIAIDHLEYNDILIIDAYYKEGLSFDRVARKYGFAKSTVVRKINVIVSNLGIALE